jgi:hypothetical protein
MKILVLSFVNDGEQFGGKIVNDSCLHDISSRTKKEEKIMIRNSKNKT